MSLFTKKKPPAPVAAPKSVATITAGLSDTLAELEAHAEDQLLQAAFQKQMAEQALAAADEYKAESELADKVAANIRTLLGS
ncbi:hypothetical protein SEA_AVADAKEDAVRA_51 [Mycobacterium phage AvadaKedavra]|uniref:Uncharacterized protein n=2 Tax=Bronvirus TaxID=1623278 RepID=A0A514U532_9CAUD|nr:hypothetical protein KNU48_gp109 [Mycobacterium phage Silverleaf]QBP29136.1 hypothetical protein SEA_SILVERLEAF_51 [Mycobacterium phage Silverleaf]QDK04056.1 hypothetical protein SEA_AVADAKEDAVRA_51 [Mycobacterium phage AvadaKedavra]